MLNILKFYHIYSNKEVIKYYWIPKIIISIFAIIFYRYIHLPNEAFLTPKNIFQSPDIKNYLTTTTYSPFYSISVQFLTKLSFSLIIKTIISQLIVAFSCISIYKSAKSFLNKKLEPISLSLMAIHPILIIYSFKFCTEIFALLGIAILIRYRVKDIELNYIKSFKNDLSYFFKLLMISLFRSQFIAVSFFEIIVIGISKFLKVRKRIFYKSQSFFILIISLIIFSFTLKLFLQINKEYLNLFLSDLWDSNYPIKPKQIYYFLCNDYCSYSNFFIQKIFAALAYLIYIPIGIILLTGARGRFTDLPWEINFGLIKIQSIKKILPENNLQELLTDFDQNIFIITVLIPLIVLSIFHIFGYISWIKNTKNLSIFLWLSPLILCIPPLFFFPYFRYFIPLIPLTCVGFSLFLNLDKLRSKNLFFAKTK